MRLFVAIDLPPELQERIRELEEGLGSSFRKMDPADIHLTIKFLGEVRDEKLDKVKAALSSVRMSEVKLESTKLGSFPHVLWLGVKLNSELAQLQQEVQRAVRPFAMNDPRAFKPHLTIARFERLSGEDEALLKGLLKERVEERWKACSFTLYQSMLTAAGPRYEALARFPA